MIAEIDTSPADRYLVCEYLISDKGIILLKDQVKKVMHLREKDNNYFEFLEWKKKESELALYTSYAYCDLNLPKTFDTIFEIGNPEMFLNVDFSINISIVNGWLPFPQIEHGHKHVLIVSFSDPIPVIFKSLNVFEGNNSKTNSKLQLGFCDKKDFEFIKSRWT